MINQITDDGKLKFATVGGMDTAFLLDSRSVSEQKYPASSDTSPFTFRTKQK